jgi:hypothetical protein
MSTIVASIGFLADAVYVLLVRAAAPWLGGEL